MATQIRKRILWHFLDRGKYTPAPSWYYPDNGEWATDPKEIIRAIRLDDSMGVKPLNKETTMEDCIAHCHGRGCPWCTI